jgi:hypothetical protein
MMARVNDPDLAVTAEVSWCYATPAVGGPGMPEAGMTPIPQKLLGRGA